LINLYYLLKKPHLTGQRASAAQREHPTVKLSQDASMMCT